MKERSPTVCYPVCDLPWVSRSGGHSITWWPHVAGALQPAQSSTKHVVYINICIRDTSYHLPCISVVFVWDLREVPLPCLVPPARTSATGITLKNAFDKYISDAAFCCWTGVVCMDVWTDKPKLATLTGSTHWPFTEAATKTLSSCTEDVIYVTCLARGPTGLFSFTVSGQLWVYHHIARMLSL